MVPAKCQVLGSSNCPLYKKGLTTPNENKVLNMIKQSTVIGVLWNAESKFGLHFRLTQLLMYVFLTFFSKFTVLPVINNTGKTRLSVFPEHTPRHKNDYNTRLLTHRPHFVLYDISKLLRYTWYTQLYSDLPLFFAPTLVDAFSRSGDDFLKGVDSQ